MRSGAVPENRRIHPMRRQGRKPDAPDGISQSDVRCRTGHLTTNVTDGRVSNTLRRSKTAHCEASPRSINNSPETGAWHARVIPAGTKPRPCRRLRAPTAMPARVADAVLFIPRWVAAAVHGSPMARTRRSGAERDRNSIYAWRIAHVLRDAPAFGRERKGTSAHGVAATANVRPTRAASPDRNRYAPSSASQQLLSMVTVPAVSND